MRNGDMPANPVPNELEGYYTDPKTCTRFEPFMGMTKREAFAMAAMQGLCADPDMPGITSSVQLAVELADALLAELDKEKTDVL